MGELFHHLQLPQAGNWQSRTGATDPGIVGAKVSQRCRASRTSVSFYVPGFGTLREGGGRRSKGNPARSGFRHRLRKHGLGVRLPEPPGRSRGSASEGIGTQDRRHSALAVPVLYLFSEERQGGYGKGNDLPKRKIRGPGTFRAPGGCDAGVSGTPERSGPTVGPGGDFGSPGKISWSGPLCFKALAPCGMRCSGSRRGAKERGGGVVPLPGPGRRLWTCVCAGASATIQSKLTRSRQTSKSATRTTPQSNSVTCLCCGRSKLSIVATR